MNRKHTILLCILIVSVVIVDQLIKYDVKTSMTLSQHIQVFNWFHIAFVENKGMAFGWTFGTKTFLTLFRLVTVALIIWYVFRLLRRNLHTGFVVCLAIIIGGAIGNIIDSIFYGMIFSQSTHAEVAHLVQWGNGYAPLLEGKVVDMFYFPLVEWNMPINWTWLNKFSFLPHAGEHCVFFSPVFNFADSCISCGVVALVIFFRKTFSQCFIKNSEKSTDSAYAENSEHSENSDN